MHQEGPHIIVYRSSQKQRRPSEEVLQNNAFKKGMITAVIRPPMKG
jgi:hypothetical protein